MHAFRLGLHRLCMGISYVTETIAAVLLVFIVVANFLGVFYRYGLRDPIGWTEEGMRYAVVWATFLAASAALALPPSDCVVFEDAEAGVQAGKAAGCRVVGIGSPHILAAADLVVSGLHELVQSAR